MDSGVTTNMSYPRKRDQESHLSTIAIVCYDAKPYAEKRLVVLRLHTDFDDDQANPYGLLFNTPTYGLQSTRLSMSR